MLELKPFLELLKMGGILAAVIGAIFSLVVLFSRAFLRKDAEQTKINKELTTHFMQFIERKDVQTNATNQEYLAAIRLIQQEMIRKTEVIKELSEQVHRQTKESID